MHLAAYDAENRLVSLTSASHGAAFTYAHDGFLAKQVVDGVETRFVRSGYLCLQERNASNNVTRSYVWNPTASGGIGGLLEMTEGANHYSYLYDGKGNVKALIDESQNGVASYACDEFGNLISETSMVQQPYKFSTKRYYAGLGLNYYGYRFYSPSIGRWMTRDPIGEEGGLNLYHAMGNNAVNLFDPLGLEYNPAPAHPLVIPVSNLTEEYALEHYQYGGGRAIRISFNEIDTSTVTVWHFTGFKDLLNTVKKKEISIDVDLTEPYKTKGNLKYVLGHITLRLVGVLTSDECRWSFKGVYKSYDDWYDFGSSTHRGPLGEALTWFGRQHKGVPYWIEIRGEKPLEARGSWE